MNIAVARNASRSRRGGKSLGSIFNNDMTNIIHALHDSNAPVTDYLKALNAIVDMKPGVFVQHVGMPDPVSYQSQVATCYPKHIVAVNELAHDPPFSTDQARANARIMNALFDAGTDGLALACEVAHERNIPIVASYRMNDAHWEDKMYLLSDFGRAHPDWQIPAGSFDKAEFQKRGLPIPDYTGVMDPAIPGVFEQRMAIFTEVADKYEIDGIELDFRRWVHMVSDPLKNHHVLTRMVGQTRRMLDEVAKKKDRPRMLLGVRVAPALDTEPSESTYPGSVSPPSPYLYNASCHALGLDVQTWIKEKLVDYVCPSLFLDGNPGLPKTREFADLAESTDVGIYPTVWCYTNTIRQLDAGGSEDNDPKTQQALASYKHDLCATVLKAYEEGADGISTFNWICHLRAANLPNKWHQNHDPGFEVIMQSIYPILSDPDAVRRYRDQPSSVPPERTM